MEKETKPLIVIGQTKKINFFDVMVDDMHSSGEKPDYACIEGSRKLTYHEVWEWISRGGDWLFIVTEHNNPDNIFMRGGTFQDMDSARKGEEQLSVGSVTEAEESDIRKYLRMKMTK